MKSLILVPVMVFSIFGCSPDSDRIITQAPQTEDELGYLVSGATVKQRDDFFNTNKKVKIRNISEEGIIMFEAVNTDIQTLKKTFPEARIYKNEFIKNQDVKTKSFNIESEIKHFNSSNEFNFRSCKNLGAKPIANLTPTSLNLTTRGHNLEYGERISMSSQRSQPHAFVGGELKKAWIVEGPQGTNIPKIINSENLDLVLDTMGVYSFYLYVQDQKQNCQYDAYQLSVTGNAPYLRSASVGKDLNIGNQEYITKLGLDKAHMTTKGEGMLIAIVDSGVNYNHPHLSDKIFINENEIPDNGIDDDKNGLIDDVHGWDFVFRDKFPFDDLGHGSHVAGLAVGEGFGVAPNAKIIPIKVGSNFGNQDMGTTFQGVMYAIRMGADIINMSYGSDKTHVMSAVREEARLYQMALGEDVLLVAASGNGVLNPRFGFPVGIDIDNLMITPAAINLENMVSVGALSIYDELAHYSNFGRNKVRVSTYGGEGLNVRTGRPYNGQMFSAFIENAKGDLFWAAQGTSMAAPVTAGIAALVRSINPNLSAGEVGQLLEDSGVSSRALQGKIKSGRILTADSAVENALKTIQLLN